LEEARKWQTKTANQRREGAAPLRKLKRKPSTQEKLPNSYNETIMFDDDIQPDPTPFDRHNAPKG
jgi:hypothetical protein